MRIIFILLSISFPVIIFGQYTVQAQFEEYKELENYNSVALETFGDLYWEKEFDLPFTFPYFDTTLGSFVLNHVGLGLIDGEIDFSLRLLAFGYMFDNVTNPDNIESDVRYKFGKIDGKDYLVVQFTKNRLLSDTSIEEFDSHVNFQYWFFDDGVNRQIKVDH